MDVDIIITDVESQSMFKDFDKVKDFVSSLEYIDQPINTALSSILQLCCQYAKDDKIVKYLLKQDANPNYLDINGKDARYYADMNKDTLAGLLCMNALCRYVDSFPREDTVQRKQVGFDLIRAEIKRHKDEEARKDAEFRNMIQRAKEWCKENDV